MGPLHDPALRDQALQDHVRSVSSEEVEHYREHGWVKLDGLLSEVLASAVLDEVLRLLQTAGVGPSTSINNNGLSVANPRQHSELLAAAAASPALGAAAAALIGEPLRLFSDSVHGRPADGTDRGTQWHQDLIAMPFDRATAGGLWTALVEITPEMGPVQYLSGSHRLPPMGRYYEPGPGAAGEYPWLLERYPPCPAFHLRPGDTLAHHCLTMHGAAPNLGDRPRFAWSTQRFDVRTRYTGLPNDRSDGRGLTIGETFDHEAFPLVAPGPS